MKAKLSNNSSISSAANAIQIEFRETLKRLADLCQSEGLSTVAYRDSELPHFMALEDDQKFEVAGRVKNYFDMVSSTKLADGKVLNNNASSVWRAFGKAGFVPPNGLIEKITNDHIIEVYNLESRQIFRSFNFFKLTTYSLEEIHCIPWYNLWKRDETHQARQLETLNKLLSGEYTAPFAMDPTPHEVVEIATQAKRSGLQRQDFGSPLFDRNNKMSGFIVLSYADRIWDANQAD